MVKVVGKRITWGERGRIFRGVLEEERFSESWEESCMKTREQTSGRGDQGGFGGYGWGVGCVGFRDEVGGGVFFGCGF